MQIEEQGILENVVCKKTPHPIDTHVGKRVRLCRMLKGMSQEELGKCVGVTFQQVQKYEKGSNRVGASRLYDFAKILSVDVADFFIGAGRSSSSDVNMIDGMKGYSNSSVDRISSFSTQGLHEAEGDSFGYDDIECNGKEVLSLVKAYSSIKDDDVRNRILSLIKTLAPSNCSEDDSE